ncbi:hypothetical protein GDO81_018941 [Engystomops pustulosus]|uniref:Uncharacterized protein n=1 Tax=Engystomops pustulosus TaxID=76066 RepID=A0AAV6YBN2_ENGPU|nr:hypothetical protein GDO81_018941 [Engystomops pustulosus]
MKHVMYVTYQHPVPCSTYCMSCTPRHMSRHPHICTPLLLSPQHCLHHHLSIPSRTVEDLERNDGSTERPYYMSTNLQKLLNKKNKDQTAK